MNPRSDSSFAGINCPRKISWGDDSEFCHSIAPNFKNVLEFVRIGQNLAYVDKIDCEIVEIDVRIVRAVDTVS